MVSTWELTRLARIKQLATVAFWKLWLLCTPYIPRPLIATVQYVYGPVVTYKMGTCGLTPTEWARFDGFHRRQLRQVTGIRYHQIISNNALNRKCACNPLNLSAIKLRWSLYGYVLRVLHEAPAQLAIEKYFKPADVVLDRRHRKILPTAFYKDLQVGKRLRYLRDLHWLRSHDRNQWKYISQVILKAGTSETVPTVAMSE